MSTQASPMTRAATAKLRAKRKVASDFMDIDEPVAAPASSEKPARTEEVADSEADPEADSEDNSDNSDNSDSDSDDEAPEAISTTQAAAATRKSAQQVSKAAEERLAETKRKRQERDATLKAQAETRKAREAVAAAAAAVQAAKDAKAAARDAAIKKQNALAAQAQAKAAESKLLPLELLESDSEDEPAPKQAKTQPPSKTEKLSRRAAARVAKAPVDRVLGSTVFRVLEDAGDTTIAPKTNKSAAGERRALMRRQRVGRPVRTGFFRK